MKLRILYIEDNPLDAELVRETLRDSGFECDMKVVEMEAELRDSLSEQRFDLILSDCSLPTYDGIAALAVARMVCPDTPFIFVSGTIGEEAAIECLKCGATDYVLKDRLARLPPVVRRALEEAEARRRHAETLRELTTSREAFFQSQKMETIGRLTGGLAHDFNNMLTVVVGYAEVIRARTKDGDPCNAFAGEILRASSRAAELVEHLLSYSRNQKLDPKVIDINDEIRLTVNMLTKLVGERIEVTTDLSEDLWPVVIDPVRFDQIMMNLAANARDAMPDGGTLIIETGNAPMDDPRVLRIPDLQRGDYVVVGVIDNGTGMDEGTMEKIFEPFFTTKPTGTGLGLAIVQSVVADHHGTIAAERGENGGARFVIELPLAAKESVE